MLLRLLRESGFEVVRVYPAIMGKKIRYAPVRLCFDVLQWMLLRLPERGVPSGVVRSFSESVLVVARRV